MANHFPRETGQSGIARSASVQFTYLPPTYSRRDAPQLRTVLSGKAELFPPVQTLPAMKVLSVPKFISFNSLMSFPG